MDALCEDVQTTIIAGVPSLGSKEHAEIHRASVRQNIETVLYVLRHNVSLSDVTAPVPAIEHARRSAQRDVSVSDLVSAYAIGQRRFMRWAIDVFKNLPISKETLAAAAMVVLDTTADYIESVTAQVIAAHSRAREEWAQDRNVLLTARVRAILRGDRRTPISFGPIHGYRLEQRHLGLSIWAEEITSDDDTLPHMREAVRAVAIAVACNSPALCVPVDMASCWAWLPLGERNDIDWDVLCETFGKCPFWGAAGAPDHGPEGFCRSHRQAVAAQAVALAPRTPFARLTSFHDVATIAPMCDDLDSARMWVKEVLGDLATDDDRHAVLRETARVFLANEGSFAATASLLHLHRNTAHYRITQAEELRRRPLRDGRLAVETALWACRWLGSAVL